jgi:hypothetical protein
MDPDPDADPDPAIFVTDLKDDKKTNLKKSYSAYYFLKIKSKKKSHKTVGIKVFLLFLLDDRVRIRIHNYD